LQLEFALSTANPDGASCATQKALPLHSSASPRWRHCACEPANTRCHLGRVCCLCVAFCRVGYRIKARFAICVCLSILDPLAVRVCELDSMQFLCVYCAQLTDFVCVWCVTIAVLIVWVRCNCMYVHVCAFVCVCVCVCVWFRLCMRVFVRKIVVSVSNVFLWFCNFWSTHRGVSYKFICTHTHTCLQTSALVCTYLHTHTRRHTHTHPRILTLNHAHIHKHTHTRTHAHTHSSSKAVYYMWPPHRSIHCLQLLW